jgi:hypothetical protein
MNWEILQERFFRVPVVVLETEEVTQKLVQLGQILVLGGFSEPQLPSGTPELDPELLKTRCLDRGKFAQGGNHRLVWELG